MVTQRDITLTKLISKQVNLHDQPLYGDDEHVITRIHGNTKGHNSYQTEGHNSYQTDIQTGQSPLPASLR